MALFTDKREQDRQGRHRNMRKVSGGKAAGLELLGYNPDGTRNTWGKINPLIGGGVTNKIASSIAKGTDTGDVLEAGQGEAWNNTLNKAALAANIATLGGSSAAIGSLSKGLNMLSGGAEGGGIGGIVGDVSNMAKNKKAMDVLNSGGEPLPDTPEDVAAEDVPVESLEDGVADGIVGKSKSVLGMPGVGDVLQSGLGLITSEVSYDAALKEKRTTYDKMSTTQNFNYL